MSSRSKKKRMAAIEKQLNITNFKNRNGVCPNLEEIDEVIQCKIEQIGCTYKGFCIIKDEMI